jgi:hypothetical protein
VIGSRRCEWPDLASMMQAFADADDAKVFMSPLSRTIKLLPPATLDNFDSIVME